MHELLADVQHLPLFVGAGLLLNLTPGVDMALVVRHSAASGFKAGAAAALGVGAGCWVHTLAAALGLTALLAASPTAFSVLRWAGAAYLVWMGLALLRSALPVAGAAGSGDGPVTAVALRRLFWQGFFTNALNPKVALFFLAFVPQFIASSATRPGLAFVLLGSLFLVNGTLVNVGIALGVAGLRRHAQGLPGLQRLGRWLNRGVGAVFIVLGLKLALGADPR